MKLAEVKKLTKKDLRGKIICFPTDTVYGVGCMIDDKDALNKIYQMKHRDHNKPLAILVPSLESIIPYVSDFKSDVKDLTDKFWPGALTIVFKKKNHDLDEVVKNLDTVGFRMPNSKVALEVLKTFGPLATTSVNISNNPPLNSLEEIKEVFNNQIDIYIEDKENCTKISSTVLDVTTSPYKVLRQGDIKF